MSGAFFERALLGAVLVLLAVGAVVFLLPLARVSWALMGAVVVAGIWILKRQGRT